MKKKFSYKTRLKIIERSLDYIEAFRYFLPDLKKYGSNYKCISPFQKENTPSFVISPDKKLWHCFSSGMGGTDIVSFIMKLENMSFKNSIEFVEYVFGLNKNVKSVEMMQRVVKCLKVKKEKIQYNSTDLRVVYERKLNKLFWNFRKRCKDRCNILESRIDYLWQLFDDKLVYHYKDFKYFLRYSYRLLSITKKTIDDLIVFSRMKKITSN